MKVLFLGKRKPEKTNALSSLMNHSIMQDKHGANVYMYNKGIAIWDIDNLRDTFGEAYCIAADICIIFGSNKYLEKRVKSISPNVKVFKYHNMNSLKKIIDMP